jgi:small GTP-binding protein
MKYLKLIVIGSSGVGKTAILNRYIENDFLGETQTTIGVEFMQKSIVVDENEIKLQIWDTAGQEKFMSITKSYFRRAIGVLLVFDLSNRNSFEELNKWLDDVHALCDTSTTTTLVGNKSDLIEERCISLTEAETFAKLNHLMYFETSARVNENIGKAFEYVARKSLEINQTTSQEREGLQNDHINNNCSC